MKKTLKYIFLLIIVLIPSIFYTIQAQERKWHIVDINPDFEGLFIEHSRYESLKCADSLNCIIYDALGGAGGYFFRRTTDGGKTWKNVYIDSASYGDVNNTKHLVPRIWEIAYPNTKLFIAIGDSGLIVRTTDKGDTWQITNYDKNTRLNNLRMFDDNFGFMTGCSGNCDKPSDLKILETIDGGLTWLTQITGYYLSNWNIINHNLFCGYTAMLNKDSVVEVKLIWVHNNFESFDTLDRPYTGLHMFFLNENQGWIAGGYIVKDSAGWQTRAQVIHHTSDGGKTWVTQRDTVFDGDELCDIRFFDENFGIASGYQGLMLVTTNGGKKWEEQIVEKDIPNGLFYMMKSIQIPSATTAYVIGQNCFIYKFTREINEVKEVENTPAGVFTLSPIPATDRLTISFNNTNHQNRIEILNLLGVKVMEFSSQEQTTTISIESLPVGVYFLRVNMDENLLYYNKVCIFK